MFVYTIKWNKKTAVWVLLILAITLALIVCAIANSDGSAGVSKPQDAAAYLESLGWQVDRETATQKTVTIPESFSEVYQKYNALQKAQGFDLSDFCGQEVVIYTFPILNYDSYSGSVVAEVYVCGGRIIGGDIHSLELDGFMHGLRLSSGSLARDPASEVA